MRKLILFLILFWPAIAWSETLYPLASLDAHLIPKGQWEFRLGAKYTQDRWFPFERKNTHREELHLPQASLNIGLASNIEIHFDYPYIYLDSDHTDSDWDSGDLTLGVKINLFKDKNNFPAVSLDLSTKLPNGDYENRFSTNETDFFALALMAKRWEDLNLFLNMGLGIIGNPQVNASQDDVFVYSVGFDYTLWPDIDLLTEIQGWAGSNHDNNYAVATMGIQYWYLSHWRFDAGVHVGLNEQSEDWGISIGVSYIWKW